MEAYYYFWLVATAFLVILELVTSGFGVICFAIGTFIAAIFAYFEFDMEFQISAFIVGSILALVFIRPFALKWLNRHSNEQVATNADAIIGRKAVVTETVDASKGTGYVKIDGDQWKAVSADGSVIEAGTEVTVVSRDSIILTIN